MENMSVDLGKKVTELNNCQCRAWLAQFCPHLNFTAWTCIRLNVLLKDTVFPFLCVQRSEIVCYDK